MRFAILGPVQVTGVHGAPLPAMPRYVCSTLAVLLLYASRPPSRPQLVEALWGDDQPHDPEGALRVRIREVRRALGADGDRLSTHHTGYRICVERGELDVTRFTDLAADGRAALDQGRAAEGARLLAQACKLWRYPALCHLPDTPALAAAKAALTERWQDACEWLLDARLELGQHHEALAEIRDCIAANPLNEHAYVQLMQALYRCGQKTAALDAYSRLRNLVAREFGQDPGPEAREMLQKILDEEGTQRSQAGAGPQSPPPAAA